MLGSLERVRRGGAIAEGGKERDEEQDEGDDEEIGEEGSGGMG